jgi:mono/diheme cytochrome c family protein
MVFWNQFTSLQLFYCCYRRECFMTSFNVLSLRRLMLSTLLGATAAITGAAAGQAQAADGAALYANNCGICHQAGGSGVPGQFPQLKERIGQIANTPEGKTYVEHVLLNGLTGAIQAGDQTYAGYMPSFKALPDDQIAAILTYVASLSSVSPAATFTASDIKTARAATLAAPDILKERTTLNAAHPIP